MALNFLKKFLIVEIEDDKKLVGSRVELNKDNE